MSIQATGANGWVICHSAYSHGIYQPLEDEYVCSRCQKYPIFHIKKEFLKRGQKPFIDSSIKSVINAENNLELNFNEIDSEIQLLKRLFNDLINELKTQGCEYFNKRCDRLRCSNDNSLAIRVANEILCSKVLLESNFNGGNTELHPTNVFIRGQEYFIPPSCRFYCCQIENLAAKLDNSTFDVILLDPPWWNKHIRRKNNRHPQTGYKMMYNESLLEIPIDNLLSSEGLVIVWCTNSKKHLDYLVHTLFPSWKVEFVSTWYWMKVTDSGVPVCKFNVDHKKPYERIIFGVKTSRSKILKNPEPNKILISVPSAIHSHKPPLTNILKDYIPYKARCLELFARYLLPGWTSFGNEVLRLQQKQLYTNI